MEPTLADYRLPLAARAANAVGAGLRRVGVTAVDLSLGSLVAAARRTTGLSDFGGDAHLEPLGRLLDSLEREAKLSLLGRLALRGQLVRGLVNRLRIADALARHPDIHDVPIRRPVFILGFPRTGTTLLHRLMAHTPGARVPLFWELISPAPPPRAEERAHDARIEQAEKLLRGLLFLAPHLPSIHPFGASEPEECFQLLENQFMSSSYGFYCNVPGYMDWLLAQDMTPAYRYYRTQLQLLAYRTPGDPWILKWPGHLLELEALLSVFPDACVVHTHRDLRSVAPSSCSYSVTLQKLFTDDVALGAVGEQWLRGSELFVARALAARTRLSAERFYDLRYEDLMADPIAAVQRIHAHFEMPFTPSMEAAMRGHLSASPSDKHGVHRYSLAQFGLDREVIEQRFGAYHERFEVLRKK